MSFNRVFLGGAAWVLAGTAVSRGLGMFGGIVAARAFGPGGYGELAMLQGTLDLVGFLAGFGLGMVTTKRVAELQQTAPAACGKVIRFALKFACASGTFAGVLLSLTADWMAEGLFDNPALGPFLRISSVLVCIQVVQGVTSGALSGLQAFRSQALLLGVSGLARILAVIAGAAIENLGTVLWGWAIADSLVLLLQWRSLQITCRERDIVLSAGIPKSEFSSLARIGLPWILNSATVVPVSWLLRALVANGPCGYRDLGAYGVANQWYNIVLCLPMLLASVALPIATSAFSAGDLTKFWQFLKTVMAARTGVALLVALPIALASDLVLGLYGTDYSAAQSSLYLLLAAGVLDTCNTSFGLFLIPAGRLWGLLTLGIIRALVSIAVCATFSSRAGALAISGAVLSGAMVMLVAGGVYCAALRRQFNRNHSLFLTPRETASV